MKVIMTTGSPSPRPILKANRLLLPAEILDCDGVTAWDEVETEDVVAPPDEGEIEDAMV
jgi:hypothetical protein